MFLIILGLVSIACGLGVLDSVLGEVEGSNFDERERN